MRPDVLYYNKNANPVLSIILLDWSCRESFHSLDYLNNQSVPRDRYEIIWIEYYGRITPQIHAGLNKNSTNNKLPLLDQWIVLGMPENIYYHKHLMYNVGILASKGKIICICDSDAIYLPTFVETIIQTFSTAQDIVLHMDEVRNMDNRFYPFNYPSIKEVVGLGCFDWVNGISRGLLDQGDPLHSRNYGACMCALRADMIAVGGADEHKDYLGHICGPYELTFRLTNAGKQEIWHEHEYLFHVWHPGTDGRDNYTGPHDGRHMSTTALAIRETGRILPLEENPAIRAARLGLISCSVQHEKIKDWIVK